MQHHLLWQLPVGLEEQQFILPHVSQAMPGWGYVPLLRTAIA